MSTVLFTLFCIVYAAVMVITFARYIIVAVSSTDTNEIVVSVLTGIVILLTLMAAPWVFSQAF